MSGTNEWTASAWTLIGAIGVLVSGGIYLMGKVDEAWMKRRKVWEEFNKESIGKQLMDSNENMEKLRTSLHNMNSLAQRQTSENNSLHDDMAVLRDQFLGVCKALGQAETDLRTTSAALQEAATNMRAVDRRLNECEDDRLTLHIELKKLQALTDETTKRADTNSLRIDTLEKDSGHHKPIALEPPSGTDHAG